MRRTSSGVVLVQLEGFAFLVQSDAKPQLPHVGDAIRGEIHVPLRFLVRLLRVVRGARADREHPEIPRIADDPGRLGARIRRINFEIEARRQTVTGDEVREADDYRAQDLIAAHALGLGDLADDAQLLRRGGEPVAAHEAQDQLAATAAGLAIGRQQMDIRVLRLLYEINPVDLVAEMILETVAIEIDAQTGRAWRCRWLCRVGLCRRRRPAAHHNRQSKQHQSGNHHQDL